MLGLLAFVSAGCSGNTLSAGINVPAEQIASTAADSMDKKLGVRPKVDCGETPIDIFEGNKIRCEMVEPSNLSVYGADVTIRYSGEGTTFGVDVSVDDNPQTVPQM
jgi:hypothetical protein